MTQSRDDATGTNPAINTHMLTNPQPPQSCRHSQHCTCVDGFVAGEVPLVAKGGLAAVTLVGFVTVDLQRMSLERGLLGEPAVALVAEEGSVLWEGRERSNQMDSAWVTFLIGCGMDLGGRRGAVRASVGTSSQVQLFTFSCTCTVLLPPGLVHTATTCMT